MSGQYPRPIRATRWHWRPSSGWRRWIWPVLNFNLHHRLAKLKGPKA